MPGFVFGGSASPAESEDMAQAPLDAAGLRSSLNDLRLNGRPVSVKLPLLERVYDLHAEIAEKFPASGDSGFGQMGLLLNRRLNNHDYWCTPTNSLCFGRTGGDGAHFSFLMTNCAITDQTPVIVTVPDMFGDFQDANVVLGRNFEDFIRLGLHCGYFSMAQFAFHPGETLKHYARMDWDDGESWFPGKNHKLVAEYAVAALHLNRLIHSPGEFAALQSEFKPLMQFKNEE